MQSRYPVWTNEEETSSARITWPTQQKFMVKLWIMAVLLGVSFCFRSLSLSLALSVHFFFFCVARANSSSAYWSRLHYILFLKRLVTSYIYVYVKRKKKKKKKQKKPATKITIVEHTKYVVMYESHRKSTSFHTNKIFIVIFGDGHMFVVAVSFIAVVAVAVVVVHSIFHDGNGNLLFGKLDAMC